MPIIIVYSKLEVETWYCVDCKYYSTKVKGSNREQYDGSCSLLKKNVYETNIGCKEFKEEEL